MIVTPRYVIGHMAKTGGDAVKAIMERLFIDLKLETDYTIYRETPDSCAEKHRAFDGTEPYRVLGFRSLPSYLISMNNHFINYRLAPLGSPETLSRSKLGEGNLVRFVQHPIHYFIRCEYLLDDLEAFVALFYGIRSSEVHNIIYSTPTKAPNVYNHDVRSFFTRFQLRSMYNVNSTWRKLEMELYGRLNT